MQLPHVRRQQQQTHIHSRQKRETFIREYIIRGDFVGGVYGIFLALASMGYTFDKYLMLWQMNKEKK